MNIDDYRWRCACCGKEMIGLPMALHFGEPVDWDALSGYDPERSGASDDFCIVRYASGEADRFIRCVLHLPVIGSPDAFQFGVWMSVSERSWNIYEEGFVSGTYSEPGCFGYLTHDIPGFEGSLYLHCDVVFQPDRLRPDVLLHDSPHPLVDAQRNGIAIAQVERWAALLHEGPAGSRPS